MFSPYQDYANDLYAQHQDNPLITLVFAFAVPYLAYHFFAFLSHTWPNYLYRLFMTVCLGREAVALTSVVEADLERDEDATEEAEDAMVFVLKAYVHHVVKEAEHFYSLPLAEQQRRNLSTVGGAAERAEDVLGPRGWPPVVVSADGDVVMLPPPSVLNFGHYEYTANVLNGVGYTPVGVADTAAAAGAETLSAAAQQARQAAMDAATGVHVADYAVQTAFPQDQPIELEPGLLVRIRPFLPVPDKLEARKAERQRRRAARDYEWRRRQGHYSRHEEEQKAKERERAAFNSSAHHKKLQEYIFYNMNLKLEKANMFCDLIDEDDEALQQRAPFDTDSEDAGSESSDDAFADATMSQLVKYRGEQFTFTSYQLRPFLARRFFGLLRSDRQAMAERFCRLYHYVRHYYWYTDRPHAQEGEDNQQEPSITMETLLQDVRWQRMRHAPVRMADGRSRIDFFITRAIEWYHLVHYRQAQQARAARRARRRAQQEQAQKEKEEIRAGGGGDRGGESSAAAAPATAAADKLYVWSHLHAARRCRVDAPLDLTDGPTGHGKKRQRYFILPTEPELLSELHKQKKGSNTEEKEYDYNCRVIREGYLSAHRFKIQEHQKTFASIFFHQKATLLEHLRAFATKTGKYAVPGARHSFIALLHGAPGTGKTSLVKAIAHYLRRHIVSLPLAHVQTRTALLNWTHAVALRLPNERRRVCTYLDEEYPEDAEFISLPGLFQLRPEEAVYVLEDLDAISGSAGLTTTFAPAAPAAAATKAKAKDEKQLLEVWERLQGDRLTAAGLVEVLHSPAAPTRRVVLLTTNHYERIHPTLKRPGMLDLVLEMGPMDAATTVEMIAHYFREELTVGQAARAERIIREQKSNRVNPSVCESWCATSENVEELLQQLAQSQEREIF